MGQRQKNDQDQIFFSFGKKAGKGNPKNTQKHGYYYYYAGDVSNGGRLASNARRLKREDGAGAPKKKLAKDFLSSFFFRHDFLVILFVVFLNSHR
jgi:hypothetical protein